jgi:hypothetical protein
VSVVVPAFNESANIPELVRRTIVLVAVVCWLALGWRFVVSDASRSPSGAQTAAKRE